MAQCRVGRFRDVLDTLQAYQGPDDIAFLAMSQHRLGQRDAARVSLERLRALLQADPSLCAIGENRAFLAEADVLIDGYPSMLPDDVFDPASAGR